MFSCYLDIVIVCNILFHQEYSVLSLFAERFTVIITI